MVARTERIVISDSFKLQHLSRQAKKLYNHANYIYMVQAGMWRGIPVKNKHYSSAYEIITILQGHPDYTCLPAQTSQQTIISLVNSWTSHREAYKTWKNGNKRGPKPKRPRMLPRNAFYPLIFTAQQVRRKGNTIYLPRDIGISVTLPPGRVNGRIRGARLLKRYGYFILEIIYDRDIPKFSNMLGIAAVDLGVNNLMTVVSTVDSPVIINGKPLKSHNQGYNKRRGELVSTYARQQRKDIRVLYGKKMFALMEKHYWYVEDYLHSVSRRFIDYCVRNDIGTVVIGYNPGWKQNVSMGKVNNQNFVGIPFLRLLDKIKYKAEDAGIRVIVTEESYTSKCSFLDNEEIGKHSKYMGRRVHRGLFRSSSGIDINADVNAAANIGRKVFPKAFVKGIVDTVSYPVHL